MTKKFLGSFAASFALVLVFTATGFSQTSPTSFPNIKIDNFGQMEANYYRGAQPAKDDYASLAALGVKTVIDLRDDPTDYEKAATEAAGMKYVNIPMSGFWSPKDEDIAAFLKLVNDPDTGTVYVHCKAGIHRTGVVGAAYRLTKFGWDYDKAYKEMKNYNFTAGLLHGAFKSYIKKYAGKFAAQKRQATAALAVAPSK